jgi:RimJ/RimL family protein N-acetyltransferase
LEIESLFAGRHLDMAALDESDAPIIARWFDNPEFVRRFEAVPARPRAAAEIAGQILTARDSQEDHLFGFRLRGINALVGYGALDGINWRNRVAWLAVALSSDYWGRGLGREAVRLMLGYAFDELGLHRVQLTVFASNSPAVGLYEKVGFQREGVYREFLLRDGQRVDMLLMGMLAREWAAMVTLG